MVVALRIWHEREHQHRFPLAEQQHGPFRDCQGCTAVDHDAQLGWRVCHDRHYRGTRSDRHAPGCGLARFEPLALTGARFTPRACAGRGEALARS